MRQRLTRREYLAELNRRLAGHPLYRPGMRFVPHPGPDPDTSTGIDWEPKGQAAADPFPLVAAEVHALFYVDGP